MSRPDLLTELRAARPAAPSELRERVLALSPAPPRRRRLSWRLGVIVAFAAAVAVAAAVVATRGGGSQTAATTTPEIRTIGASGAETGDRSFDALGAPAQAKTYGATVVPAPSAGRLQNYRAYLELRVPTAGDVSSASQRAQTITRSLGGYVLAVSVDARGKKGSAALTLRVPRQNVQEAVARLSQLGTVVAENVLVQDLQAQVNANDRRIERLQQRLRDLRAKEQTDEVKRRIDALTKQIQQLQRTRATTVRQAHYATIQLDVATKKAAAARHDTGPGPLHGLGVAFTWIGIGAVYALALGTPFVVLAVLLWLAARAVRRRREEALLSSP
jgi:Domain of unknown function (DUF4349)